MEPPALKLYLENDDSSSGSKDNKKVLMCDDDIVEIEHPPPGFSSKSSKRTFEQKEKKVIYHEVIDVDELEDSADLVILDEKIDTKNKRKAVKDNSESCNQVEDYAANFIFDSSTSNVVQDDSDSDLLFQYGIDHVDSSDEDYLHPDDYLFYLENETIPPGVEARIPSMRDFNYNATQVSSGSGSFKCTDQMHTVGSSSSKHADVGFKLGFGSFECPVDPLYCASGSGPPISFSLSQTSEVKPCRIPKSSDDLMEPDYYAFLQSYLEKANVPPDVETSIPLMEDNVVNRKNTGDASGSANTSNQMQTNTGVSWFPNHAQRKLNLGSSSFIPMSPEFHDSQVGQSSPWCLPQISEVSKTSPASKLGGTASNHPPSQSEKVLGPSSSHVSLNHFTKESSSLGVGSAFKGYSSHIHNKSGTGNANDTAIGLSMPWDASVLPFPFDNFASDPIGDKLFPSAPILSEEGAVRISRDIKEDDVLRKFEVFKKFDSVEDHADHYYTSRISSVNQAPKNWAKRIQEEWRILENDLPDSIFVRVYETRMDLLRAVIVGAEGTPYHNGLFFFDIFFPDGYPDVPPLVHYHSWGLRINPNLYESGKVCLSLLGTWSGDRNEKWLPGVSTVLQVLVSIQALVLNQKPYFNEPGYEFMINTAKGEKLSQQYSDKAFFRSLKTMVYTVRKPPKHFDEFVFGHFYKHARDILMSCEAQMDGVKSDKTNSRSDNFRNCLPLCVEMLLKEFSAIGIKDMERFEALAKPGNNEVGDVGAPAKDCNMKLRGFDSVKNIQF